MVCKVYERVKKLQNENKEVNISSMQTAGKKNRSTIDNLIIMNAIIEKQRLEHKTTYILFADAEKCFDKLWLKDSLIEMERIGYDKSGTKIFYEINKTTEIVVDAAIGNTESIEITEVVKQGSKFGPTMCCAMTAKVNDVGERADYKYWQIEIGMSIYVDDISVAGGPEEAKKGIRKCARMEVENKIKYSLSKTKYMIVRTSKEKEEDISEQMKAGKIQKTKKHKCLGITINEEGNLKWHIEELKQKGEAIIREIEIIGSRNQVGKEEIRVQLKLFEACFMSALIYGIEAWGCIKKEETKEIERIRGKALKTIFKLPLSTAYTGMLMETGT